MLFLYLPILHATERFSFGWGMTDGELGACTRRDDLAGDKTPSKGIGTDDMATLPLWFSMEASFNGPSLRDFLVSCYPVNSITFTWCPSGRLTNDNYNSWPYNTPNPRAKAFRHIFIYYPHIRLWVRSVWVNVTQSELLNPATSTWHAFRDWCFSDPCYKCLSYFSLFWQHVRPVSKSVSQDIKLTSAGREKWTRMMMQLRVQM